MNRYDYNYSQYYKEPDEDYPVGSAVNSTNEDSLDGTPILAKFFNDVIGFMQAVFFGVNGKDAEVTGEPETARKSDVWNAIKKHVADSITALKDLLTAKIEDEAGARQAADDGLTVRIDGIDAKIPAQASTENQLADKNFVNSSIATNTAFFLGTFDSIDRLNAYAGTKTNNDYAFVTGVDESGNVLYNRYKWNAELGRWVFEYTLNNTGFTAAQFAAINSGITKALVDELSSKRNDFVPVGVINAYGGSTPPSGWLLCNGQAVSRTTYKDLFGVIGISYGGGDGVNTFNVPDLRETVPVGAGTRASNSGDVYNVGQFKNDQYASHSHNVNAHNHSFSANTSNNGSWSFAMPALDRNGGKYQPVCGRTNWNVGNFSQATANRTENIIVEEIPNSDEAVPSERSIDTVGNNNRDPFRIRYAGHTHSVSGTTGNSSPATGASGSGGGTHGKRLGVNYIIKAL